MRVLVTRPAGQAGEWVDGLRTAGLDAVALPLIGIVPPDDLAPVRAAWDHLPQRALVMFVSPNAADQFFAARPEGATWPAGVVAASPGPGTTGTLLRLGVPPAQLVEPAADAPQFDSEALWAVIGSRPWDGASVLIVRGTRGRDWLAGQLAGQGAHVDHVAAYRRATPVLDATGKALLHTAVLQPGRHLWFFSSSEAVDHLAALAPPAADWTGASALATHPRIAERARALGVGRVIEARPAMAAVVACIQSFA
jgi:uroporphyrinogen-III synthase